MLPTGIAVAIPALEEPPVVIDMATTNSSLGKIMVKAMHGEAMPEGWVIDAAGKAITDSALVDDGILTRIGGAKGFGLSMVIGFLAGTLNGAAFGSDVIHIGEDPHSETNTGQFIMAIDIAHFLDPALFKAACRSRSAVSISTATQGAMRKPSAVSSVST